MPDNNNLAVELKQRINGFKESSPLETLRKYSERYKNEETLIDPETSLLFGTAVMVDEYLKRENGIPAEIPSALQDEEQTFLKPSSPETEEVNIYERVRNAFMSQGEITDIDSVAKDFAKLSQEKQHELLKAISEEDSNRTLRAIGEKIHQDFINLDLANEKTREQVRQAIKFTYGVSKKEWSKEDVLQSAYVDLASPYIHDMSEVSTLFAPETQKKVNRMLTDFTVGVAVGGAFAPAAMAKYGISAAKYASLLVATEATLTGAAEKLTEKYGMKGLLPLVPLSIILAPETITGFSRLGVRLSKNIITNGKFTIRDLTAASVKAGMNKDGYYDLSKLAVKIGDETSDEIQKNIGRRVALAIENPYKKSRNIGLSVTESTTEQYNALKLPIKTRFKSTIEPGTNTRVTDIIAEASDDGKYKLKLEGMETSAKELVQDEFVNRTIQASSPLVDIRLFGEMKDLVNRVTLSSGIRDVLEKTTFLKTLDLIDRLPRLSGEERGQVFTKIIDDINKGALELNNYTNKIINKNSFSNDVDDYIKTIAEKGVGKHSFETVFWNKYVFNQFYNTNLDNVVRKDLGFVDALSMQLNKVAQRLNAAIFKGLSGKELDNLNILLETSTILEKEFRSVDEIIEFDSQLAQKISPKVFTAYKEVRSYLDVMGRHVATKYADKLKDLGFKTIDVEDGYRVVKPVSEPKNGLVDVLDIETGKTMSVAQEVIKDIDYRKFLLEGYFPRMVDGDINLTILNKDGNKVRELRGFINTKEAAKRAIIEEEKLNPGEQLIIHHRSKSPIPTGTKQHLLSELDEFSDLPEVDSLVEVFKRNGATPENVRAFIDLMDDETVRRYQKIIEFNRAKKGYSPVMMNRKFRFDSDSPTMEQIQEFKNQIQEYIVNRLDVESAMEKYANIFTSTLGIDRIKENLRMNFIKKFGHLLQRDALGNVDWLHFNTKAFKDADSATRTAAKHIQDQLRRIHKMPTETELKFNNLVSSLKEKWYRRFPELSDNGVVKKLNLSSDLAQYGNNAITAFLGMGLLWFEPFYVFMQGFQSVPTLLANSDVAVEALAKSISHTTKSIMRSNPITRGLSKTVDEDWEILVKSGLFERVEMEDALGIYKLSRMSAKPMVWGEMAQRVVAGNVALAKARKLGLKGDELTRFVYDEGTKYALDMSTYSKTPLSEGFLKWNIGLFSRYFTQMGQLFWKGLKPDQKIAVGLGMYSAFGIDGIPFMGDIRSVYETQKKHLVNAVANMTMWLYETEVDTIYNGNPGELVDRVYPDIDANERLLKIQRVKEDMEYQKKLIEERKEEMVVDALEKSKGIVDFFDKIFFTEGAMSSLSGRLAFNDFVTQKMRTDTFLTPLVLVKSIGAGASLAESMMQATWYSTLGYNAPDEVRTEAYKLFFKDVKNFLATFSPNMLDMAQGLNIGISQVSDTYMELLELAGLDNIETASGKIIKPMEEATLEDALRLTIGVGYTDINKLRGKEYRMARMLQSLSKQARIEAEKTFEAIELGNVREAEKLHTAMVLRNKVYYGDDVSSKLYHNSYITHLNKLIEENREFLADVYTGQKRAEILQLWEDLTGVSLSLEEEFND